MLTKLLKIQQELKAPKGQTNKFGGYKYRSAEDILEAVKPICSKYGCVIALSDTIENIGERYYIKASASIIDTEKTEGNVFTVTAYAREPEQKKGMDEAQITGTASSYARKYAMNGLFAIDDTKDADTDAYTEVQKKAPETPKMATADQIKKMRAKYSDEELLSILDRASKKYGKPINDLKELTSADIGAFLK